MTDMTDPMLAGPAALAMKRARDDNDADDLIDRPAVKRGRTVKARKAASKTSKPQGVALGTPAQADVQLVAVKNNPKVLRCLRCRSFVGKTKPHTINECNQVLHNKANPVRRGGKGGKFRMTPKRRGILDEVVKTAAKSVIQENQMEKALKSLEKWHKKSVTKGKLSKTTSELMKRVIDSLEVDYNAYNKKLSSLKNKLGL